MTFTPANAHTLSRSIRVAAPPAKVWELITTVARIIEWYDTWDAVEHATDEERLRWHVVSTNPSPHRPR